MTLIEEALCIVSRTSTEMVWTKSLKHLHPLLLLSRQEWPYLGLNCNDTMYQHKNWSLKNMIRYSGVCATVIWARPPTYEVARAIGINPALVKLSNILIV